MKEEFNGISPEITDNAKKVLEKRYLKKDDFGKLTESPAEMFMRVARNIATADSNYGRT